MHYRAFARIISVHLSLRLDLVRMVTSPLGFRQLQRPYTQGLSMSEDRYEALLGQGSLE
jgi:hypothetical protein